MAFVHGKSTKFLVAEVDLSTYFKETNVSQQIDMAETSTYGNTYKTFIQGLASATINASGLYDSTATVGPDAKLNSILASTSVIPVTFAPEGLAIGTRLYSMSSTENNVEIASTIGDVVSINAAFQTFTNTGNKLGGVSLHQLAAESASTDSTGVDGAAATTNGGFAALHVTANSRSANVVVKVQHSTDNVTFADLVTFTTISAGTTTAELSTVAAGTTVNRYLRAQSTLTAGTGSITYTVTFVRSS